MLTQHHTANLVNQPNREKMGEPTNWTIHERLVGRMGFAHHINLTLTIAYPILSPPLISFGYCDGLIRPPLMNRLLLMHLERTGNNGLKSALDLQEPH